MKTLIHKALKSDIAKILFLIAILICVSTLSFANEESWRDEYNSICGDSQEAVLLPREEINLLIDKCDNLLNKINESDNPRKKIFIFRIEKCKNFYKYIADLSNDGGTKQ